ncbi:MAG: XrtA system polysaccharide deacetylase [Burkholderiaceae bacterium]
MSSPIKNAFTVDVEDYFQVAAFDRHIDRDNWDTLECRVEKNVEQLLTMLAQADAKATFFTLGWIAERYPRLIQSISAAGHEVASHGYGHQKATTQNQQQFREDVLRAKGILEDITGEPVRGYRAPSFSIAAENLWVHDVLATTGHDYSSSIYPVRHDHYGIPDADRFVHKTDSDLVEIPLTTVPILNRNIPAAGGGYFRLMPYSLSAWMIKRVNQRENKSAIFYCHPWEIDADQPKVAQASAKSRFRHYVNLAHMQDRLSRLLQDFQWDRVDSVFADHLPASQKLTGAKPLVYEA